MWSVDTAASWRHLSSELQESSEVDWWRLVEVEDGECLEVGMYDARLCSVYDYTSKQGTITRF